MILVSASTASTTVFDNVKNVVDVAGTFVTAAAIIVGGLWAYFKFVKNRTYRPRLEVTMQAQWRVVRDVRLLQARVTVKNIGASSVRLIQHGTGLRINRLGQVPMPEAVVVWSKLRVFPLLVEHQWIDPG